MPGTNTPLPAPTDASYLDILISYVYFVHETYSIAAGLLNARTRSKYQRLDIDDIINAAEAVATRIRDYNIGHSIYPRTLDRGKFVCFTAAELYRRSVEANQVDPAVFVFESQPLFFGYFTHLDDLYCAGHPLNYIGLFSKLSESLHLFLEKDQWLAPFTYFRAMEVTLEFDALR